MSNDIMVSILCTAYNHGEYIREAIEGFVNQKTDFNYEIIIHDDASTDNTADIIKEYAEKYSNIVPIIQKENQYSKRIPIYQKHIYSIAKGKYFAICEGDDYWTDNNKLQRQVEFLEKNSEYSMCCHNSTRYYQDRDVFELENPVKNEGDVLPEEMINEPYKTWIATASIMFRRELAYNRPDFFLNTPVGDLPLRLYCFSKGKVFYFSDSMCVYRRSVADSWVDKFSKNIDMKIDFHYRMERFFYKYDEYTNGIYNEFISKRCKRHKKRYYKLLEDYPKVKNNYYFKQMPRRFKVKTYIRYYYPRLYKIVNRFNKVYKSF